MLTIACLISTWTSRASSHDIHFQGLHQVYTAVSPWSPLKHSNPETSGEKFGRGC